MPDKNDWGKGLESDVEIDAYLELLNSKNQRNSLSPPIASKTAGNRSVSRQNLCVLHNQAA